MSANEFIPLKVAVLTVSDTRNEETDKSGSLLVDRIKEAGHSFHEKIIVKDDVYQIRAVVSKWIAAEDVHVIITTGGTGFANRDSTPEAIKPLLDKEAEGFSELFRQVSSETIGSSTIQSRTVAGLVNNTVVFSLPGSTNACKTGWDKIIVEQIDNSHKPCNFVPALNLKR